MLLAAGTGWASADVISGPATVLDGDTIEVDGRMIRLEGIDAPELGQTCIRFEKEVDCGVIARAALLDLVTAVEVICEPRGQDHDELMTAFCTADGFDVGGNMVYTGWALPVPGWTAYDAIKDGAIEDRRGLWATEFVEPWVWRENTP